MQSNRPARPNRTGTDVPAVSTFSKERRKGVIDNGALRGPSRLVFNIDMERKLVQIGSSLAVTLPSEVVKEFKLKKGQSVCVSVHPLTGVVSVKPGVALVDEGKVTRRVRASADALIRRREKLYSDLAR